jgi:hypothetical protein
MKKRHAEEQIIGFSREAAPGCRSRSYAGSMASANRATTHGRPSSAA